MTDGIIQEVFNKRYNQLKILQSDKEKYTIHLAELFEQYMKEIEQELIQKIKQECLNTGLNSSWISIKVLIGDCKNE